jgi:endonuclease/exonuclease/phosphatase family metal-dependent hydrolase
VLAKSFHFAATNEEFRMLQVVTVNVGGHRNQRDNPIEPQQVAREIKANLSLDYSRPTILALQEIIQLAYPQQEILDIGDILAQELGQDYRAYFAPKMNSLAYAHRNAWEKSSYAGAAYAAEGNSILTNLPLTDWPWPMPAANFPAHGQKSPIITPLGFPRLYSTGNRDTEPRNLIIAPLLYQDKPLYFMACHLSTLKGEDRQDPNHPISRKAGEYRLSEIRHILHLLEELRSAESFYGKAHAPVILAGDFNVDTEREEMQHLQSQFMNLKIKSESPVATHAKHGIEIDHILINDPNQQLGNVSELYILEKLTVPEVLDHFPKIAVFA